MNMSLQAKQLIRSATSIFFVGWEIATTHCTYRQLVIGSFIMTVCWLMYHILCRVFWQNIKSPRWLNRPYIPDFGPYGFWLFPKLKSPSKGKKFQTIDEIQENTMGQLMEIPTKDFEQWKRYQENCVRFHEVGAYFEGDCGVIVLCTVFLVSWILFSKCPCFSYCMAIYFLDRPQTL